MKGATYISFGREKSPVVSIHAPVKGATVEVAEAVEEAAVSIHAPVKGATRGRRVTENISDVSIHAPVKGATTKHDPKIRLPMRFNPRACEGRDLEAEKAGYLSIVFQSTRL